MSRSTIALNESRSTEELRPPRVLRPIEKIGGRPKLGILVLFLLVFGAELAFGMWMNVQGFRLNDAINRATGALMALYSSQAPHLASVDFIWMPLPSFAEFLWVAFYPLWPGIVSSGFASTATT